MSSAELFGVLRMQILVVREVAQWWSVLFLQRTCLVSSIYVKRLKTVCNSSSQGSETFGLLGHLHSHADTHAHTNTHA